MDKLDYKKEYKDLYLPKSSPVLIDVPEMTFIMVDGSGAPEGEEYQQAMQVLYALCYTIKMSHMGGRQPEGYFEYVVPPLEGLWWGQDGFDLQNRASWLWTSMIRQPEFVTKDVFDWAADECRKKKPDIPVHRAKLENFAEGKCVQIMHTGPYSEEPATIQKMRDFIEQSGLKNETGSVRKHHEIYLADPRKVAPEKWKTVIRLPVG